MLFIPSGCDLDGNLGACARHHDQMNLKLDSSPEELTEEFLPLGIGAPALSSSDNKGNAERLNFDVAESEDDAIGALACPEASSVYEPLDDAPHLSTSDCLYARDCKGGLPSPRRGHIGAGSPLAGDVGAGSPLAGAACRRRASGSSRGSRTSQRREGAGLTLRKLLLSRVQKAGLHLKAGLHSGRQRHSSGSGGGSGGASGQSHSTIESRSEASGAAAGRARDQAACDAAAGAQADSEVGVAPAPAPAAVLAGSVAYGRYTPPPNSGGMSRMRSAAAAPAASPAVARVAPPAAPPGLLSPVSSNGGSIQAPSAPHSGAGTDITVNFTPQNGGGGSGEGHLLPQHPPGAGGEGGALALRPAEWLLAQSEPGAPRSGPPRLPLRSRSPQLFVPSTPLARSATRPSTGTEGSVPRELSLRAQSASERSEPPELKPLSEPPAATAVFPSARARQAAPQAPPVAAEGPKGAAEGSATLSMVMSAAAGGAPAVEGSATLPMVMSAATGKLEAAGSATFPMVQAEPESAVAEPHTYDGRDRSSSSGPDAMPITNSMFSIPDRHDTARLDAAAFSSVLLDDDECGATSRTVASSTSRRAMLGSQHSAPATPRLVLTRHRLEARSVNLSFAAPARVAEWLRVHVAAPPAPGTFVCTPPGTSGAATGAGGAGSTAGSTPLSTIDHVSGSQPFVPQHSRSRPPSTITSMAASCDSPLATSCASFFRSAGDDDNAELFAATPPPLAEHVRVIPLAQLRFSEAYEAATAGARVLLGRGGFADVYLGEWHSEDLGILRVAIKVRKPQHTARDEARSRRLFRAELEHWSQLPMSANIVKCYGGALAGAADAAAAPAVGGGATASLAGRDYLVLEFLAIGSLEDWLQRERLERGCPLTVREVINIGLALAEAGSAIHPLLSHGDIKPRNILFGEDHCPKLADFGLSTSRLAVCGRDAGVGTLHYMAPEVLRGEHADHSADIFAIGLVMWECMTGRKPWRHLRNRHQLLEAGSRGPTWLPIPATCPPALATLLRRCWFLTPEHRIGCADLLKLLHVCLLERETARECISAADLDRPALLTPQEEAAMAYNPGTVKLPETPDIAHSWDLHFGSMAATASALHGSGSPVSGAGAASGKATRRRDSSALSAATPPRLARPSLASLHAALPGDAASAAAGPAFTRGESVNDTVSVDLAAASMDFPAWVQSASATSARPEPSRSRRVSAGGGPFGPSAAPGDDRGRDAGPSAACAAAERNVRAVLLKQSAFADDTAVAAPASAASSPPSAGVPAQAAAGPWAGPGRGGVPGELASRQPGGGTGGGDSGGALLSWATSANTAPFAAPLDAPPPGPRRPASRRVIAPRRVSDSAACAPLASAAPLLEQGRFPAAGRAGADHVHATRSPRARPGATAPGGAPVQASSQAGSSSSDSGSLADSATLNPAARSAPFVREAEPTPAGPRRPASRRTVARQRVAPPPARLSMSSAYAQQAQASGLEGLR